MAAKLGSVARAGQVRGGAIPADATPPVQPPAPDRRRSAAVIFNGSAVPRSARLAAGVDPWIERNRQVRRRDAVAGGGRGYLL
ncbi:hypothetical protein HC031_22195 [Planosporangium thailandense]|uniref:Uncharacterized protein n=1 Tax=Planosporangium thailandense TaxID=765197 RepID=A0ABX0Y313_9ACTN|nr:hypothetical protein [Planosporangium thailandense]NJC72408.1 hypothetical protein [Planosporangium thailandense]